MASWRFQSGTSNLLGPAPSGTPATNDGSEAIYVGDLIETPDGMLLMVWDASIENPDNTFGNVRAMTEGELRDRAIAERLARLESEYKIALTNAPHGGWSELRRMLCMSSAASAECGERWEGDLLTLTTSMDAARQAIQSAPDAVTATAYVWETPTLLGPATVGGVQ
jgi:hypothetical protein